MEFAIYLIIGIIYAIATATGHNGRLNSGPYGLYDVGDGFFIDDRLERIRNEYEVRLKLYYQNNKPRTYLKNSYCELRLINDGNSVYFYCKERSLGGKKGRFFEVRGNNEHASTMWAIIDMEFTKQSDYTSIRALYYRLNQGRGTTGGMRYYNEPWIKKYPNYDDKYAQNEFCRMELKKLADGSFGIFCSEVWSKKPKQFLICGNKYLLMKIISEFAEEKDKFQTYDYLYRIYYQRLDCDVKELNFEEKTDNTTQKKDTVSVKTIHVDTESKEETEQKSMQEEKFKSIEKYDERNLDL